MPVPFVLPLTDAQLQELRALRDHAPRPYLRERAAVLLKIAAGQSIRRVAHTGGLKPHHVDTVRAWIARYLHEGASGLVIRGGRGRKPACFPPPHRTRARAGR